MKPPTPEELARRTIRRALIKSLTYEERRARCLEIVASDPELQRYLGLLPAQPHDLHRQIEN